MKLITNLVKVGISPKKGSLTSTLSHLEGDETLDGGGGGGGTPPPPPPCNRNKRYLRIDGWYTNDVSAIESWDRGCPEIRLAVFGVDAQNNYTSTTIFPQAEWEPGSRSDVDGRWWTFQNNLFLWDSQRYGDDIRFFITERDGGSARSLPIKVKYSKGGLTIDTEFIFNILDGDWGATKDDNPNELKGFPVEDIATCELRTVGTETLTCRISRHYYAGNN